MVRDHAIFVKALLAASTFEAESLQPVCCDASPERNPSIGCFLAIWPAASGIEKADMMLPICSLRHAALH
jgi:hypothetical protein